MESPVYSSYFFDCARYIDCFNFQQHVTEMRNEAINEISINEVSTLTVEIGQNLLTLSHPTTPFRLVKKDKCLIVNEPKPKFCDQIYNTTRESVSRPKTRQEEEVLIEEARKEFNAVHDENEMAYRKSWILKGETTTQFLIKFININTDEDTKIRVYNNQSHEKVHIASPISCDILPYKAFTFVKKVKQVTYSIDALK